MKACITFLYLFISSLLICHDGSCTVWRVGPLRTYTLPSQVAGLVSNGDTVEIDAGSYMDCAVWNNNNLLLTGVGKGFAHLQTQVCQSKGIWVIYGKDITIENIEFSGAVISNQDGENGAGIRAQGGSLTIKNCYFHNNQEGILENPSDSVTDIIILNSVFEFNGCDTGYEVGYEHNMYIGHARSFTLEASYSHGAVIGHNLKSRAYKNYILYNRIMDDSNGTSSRDVDLPNGGQAVVMGNLFEKGPLAQNDNTLEFGLEGYANPSPQNLYIINNTFVDDKPSGCSFIDMQPGADTLLIQNNIFAGLATLLIDSAAVFDSMTNLVTTSIPYVDMVNPIFYNYHLMANSPAINKGRVAGHYDTLSLMPKFQYVDSVNIQPRIIVGNIDIGAYEFNPINSVSNVNSNTNNLQIIVTQNQDGSALIIHTNCITGDKIIIKLYDIIGRQLTSAISSREEIIVSLATYPEGIYILNVCSNTGFYTGKLLLSKR